MMYTRGEKAWALDVAASVMWHSLHARDMRGVIATTPWTDQEVERAMHIVSQLADEAHRMRGRLHRAKPASARTLREPAGEV